MTATVAWLVTMKPVVELKDEKGLRIEYIATCDPLFIDDQPIKLRCHSEWDILILPKGTLTYPILLEKDTC